MTLEELVSRLEAEDFRFFLIPGSNPVEVDIDSDQPLQQALMEAVPMISSVLPSRTFLSPILYSCRVFAAMRRYIRVSIFNCSFSSPGGAVKHHMNQQMKHKMLII